MTTDPALATYNAIADVLASDTPEAGKADRLAVILESAYAAGVRPVPHDPATLGPLAPAAGRVVALLGGAR